MFAAALSQEDVVGQEIVIMLDANARVGSVTSVAIGPSGPEEHNDNGNRLHQHLLGAELFAVNTVSSPGPTWKGASYKLDHVISLIMSRHCRGRGDLQERWLSSNSEAADM